MISEKRPPNKFKRKLKVSASIWNLKSKLLKHQVSYLRKLNISNQNNHKELEQYGRRLYLQIDGVPIKTMSHVMVY